MNSLNYPPTIHRSDVRPEQYDAIVAVLKGLPGVKRVTLYGSRARGEHRYNSDIDLYLEGIDLGYQTRADAHRKLYDLWIPHRMDILLDAWLEDEALSENIQQEGVVLWQERDWNELGGV